MKKINTIKVAFAGYDDFNKSVYKTITDASFKDKTLLDVQIDCILVQKDKNKDNDLDILIPFTTDFEYIIYDYFDVLILGKPYSPPNHNTVSLARQSLTTGKDIIVTDAEFIKMYGDNVREVAFSHGLKVEEAYTIDNVVKNLVTIASYRAQKSYDQRINGVDSQ